MRSNHASTSAQRAGKLQTCGTQLRPKGDGDICSGLMPAFQSGEPDQEGWRDQSSSPASVSNFSIKKKSLIAQTTSILKIQVNKAKK